MTKIIKYGFLRELSAFALVRSVNEEIDAGWQPLGPMMQTQDGTNIFQYGQTIVVYEEAIDYVEAAIRGLEK